MIEAIRTGAEPPLARADYRLVCSLLSEYFATNRVSDQTYARALETLGEGGLVDLIGIVGYYGLVSMTLNVFEVPVPAGEAEPL